MLLAPDDPLAVAISEGIQRGDLVAVEQMLTQHPELASAAIGSDEPGGMQRSLLHVATDWPGHFPNNAAMVRLLIAHGADVGARFVGPHTETPLHWAASSDDVEVLDALLDAGADIEADGAVIAGGTPIADATAFGQWNVARRLVERGARTNLYESAVMGLLDRVTSEVDDAPADMITAAFWGACSGGQLEVARVLADHGADTGWVSVWDGVTPLQAARRARDAELALDPADRQPDRHFAEVVEWLEAHAAESDRR